jgi:hypothetical protein
MRLALLAGGFDRHVDGVMRKDLFDNIKPYWPTSTAI